MTIAVIRIRGLINVEKTIKDTLMMLRLETKHSCVLLPEAPVYIGMVNKVKDYVTFGKVSDDTIKLLMSKRLKRKDKKKVTPDLIERVTKLIKEGKLLKDDVDVVPIFVLNPPKKGFEKEGIKKTYVQGGALGKRDNIDNLIKRMVD
ncbi:50S ribosomal protein L30 [Candidatus Tiddalikarchaeum anstoanum]|nr:50S ribosomal protein L30 [Candidatus Tiddalikarchaeum anstoanum]